MPTFNILDFNAIGDGKSPDTVAIQSAIEACSSAGGGTVLFPAGKTYFSGALRLKSNVELHLERGAILLASDDYADYPATLNSDAVSGGEIVENAFPKRAFIIAWQAHNVAITGGGTIDGCGRAFVGEDLGYIYKMRGAMQYLERPFTLHLLGCNKVTLRDVTFKDGAFWTVRLSGCEDVLIHGIRIHNDLKLPNNDGIDLDRCRRVRISDCDIVTGDDCICLKACSGTAALGDCENITVTGCTLTSTSSALIIGAENRSAIRNVIFDACAINASHRGLAIHLSEGGDVENVIFSNMIVETRLFNSAWWGRGEPIYITAIPWDNERGIGHIRNVRFVNVLAHAENSVFIQGWETGLIDGILLENVRLELDKWSKLPGGEYDLRPCPGEGLIPHPTAGFFFKNAANITLRNCELVVKNCPTFGEPVVTENVTGFVNQGFVTDK